MARPSRPLRPPTLGAVARTALADAGPAASARAPGPMEMLADLVDLGGSVALAEALVEISALAQALGGTRAIDGAGAAIASRLDDVELRLHAVLEDVLWGSLSPLAAPRLARAWADHGENATPESVARFAQSLAGRLADRVADRVDRARGQVSEIRRDLADEVDGTAPHALALERLDTVLDGVTAARRRSLLARVIPATTHAIATALAAALASPHGTEPLAVSFALPLGGPSPLRRSLERMRDAGRALVHHERRRVEALAAAVATRCEPAHVAAAAGAHAPPDVSV